MNIAVSILFVIALLAIASRAAASAAANEPSVVNDILGAK